MACLSRGLLFNFLETGLNQEHEHHTSQNGLHGVAIGRDSVVFGSAKHLSCAGEGHGGGASAYFP